VRRPEPVGHRALRTLADACLRILVIAVTAIAVLYVAGVLRLVVLPLALAVVLATLLHAPARWLRARGLPDAAAALAVVLGALVIACAAVVVVVPPAASELDELDVSVSSGIAEVQRWASDGVLGVSGDEVSTWLERAEQQVRDNAGGIARGAVTGATLLVELLAGLALTVVLLFFVVKDGERIWTWVRDLAPRAQRDDVQAIGERVWATLGGYLRGVTLVALFDAVFIALALVVIGVPLVLPLALLTFVGAYVPIVGAFVAGIAAVLVALVALGPGATIAVAVAVLIVQQVESNVFQPVVIGRSVRVHPVAILLGVTAGGVLGGIVGAIVATPVIAVLAAVLRYLRFEREPAVTGR
jgi:putative heme transporter